MKRILILIVLVLLIRSADAALTDNLQLHASFDGNADDISGNGNDGIVYGATLTTDRNGNPNSAYQFNGVDSYIDFGSSDLGLTGGSEMTISVWVKPDTPTTWHSTVLASHAFYRPYAIKTYGLGSAVTAQYNIATSSGRYSIDADSRGIIVGYWYHIACTYDGTTASIYVDGELKNNVGISGTLSTTTQSIFAGANPYPTHYYNGAIDDIRIWNRALSEEEIIEVYSGDPVQCVDADGDGWYSTAVCNDSVLYDCLDDPAVDPYAPFVNPGVIETYDLCSNGYDDDCIDGDLICDDCPLDNDYPVSERCLCEGLAVETGYCCSDGTYSLVPCDETPPAIDNDGDGWYSDGQYNLDGLPDCDDNNPFLFPLNSNNYCDCDDSDGFGQGTVEICGNGIDEDCDGYDLPCTGDIYVGGYEVNHDFDEITYECLDLIRTKRILFGSRSIGLSTLAGLRSLAEKDPKYALNIERYRIDTGNTIPDNAFDSPKMVHFIYELYPEEERWNYFDNYIRNNPGEIDVAFEYIYSPVASQVYHVYDAYTTVLDALVEDFPDINFLIATHTVDTVTSPETHFNIEAKWYSETVIEDYTGVLPIFDLRDIESTRSDDSICQFEYDGTVYRNLCSEYNMSGDTLHPDTEEATERLGKGIFIILSRMLCEQQPQPVECTQDSDCDDNLACNGQETCVDNMCVEGTPIDCSAYDIAPVGTCNNDPDNNPLTWDYGAAFISECIEPGICTEGDQEITSTCSVSECGAECDAANPCPSTDCDGLDGCVGDDFYDYHDVENNCLGDCSCQTNPCESLTIYPNDERCTGNPVDEGLKLYAPFDGNADDMSGNGNNGIVYGAVLTADRNGNPNSAYQFNGVDSYIDFGSSDLGLTGSSEITFCAWVKPDQPTTYHSHVLSSEQFYRPYTMKTRGLGSAVTAQCAVRTVDGGVYIDADTGGIIVGNWYHILCRYDGIIASIYVDGELKNSVSLSGLLRVPSQQILAGAQPSSPPKSFFNGAIDDIRIWNRALSEEEIIEVYSDDPAPCIDADGDGWYSTAVCNDSVLYDCLDDPAVDPYAPFVNPGVTETYDLCSNGYDDDCIDGDLICNDCPLDDDNTVTQRCLCEGLAVETGYCCSDGTYSLVPCDEAPPAIDNDGDGWYSDGQYNLDGLPDCDDNNPFLFPLNSNNYCDCDDSDGFDQGTVEICGNGIDEDCDGYDLPCTGDIIVGGYEVNHDFDEITDECLDLIRTKTILFGGRSISGNTIYGLYFLADKNPRYELDIVSYNLPVGETIPDDIFDTPKFVHYTYLISPIEGRWTTFDYYSRTYHDKIDAAFQFLHSSYPGCPEALFDDYTPVFDALVEDVPDIQFAIATHTLDTRTTADARFNFEGKWYSDKIKETYTGIVPIFDLGDIESTRADDSICEFEYDGTIYRRMCPEYNTNNDYIHPNSEEARERLGKGIFVLLSKMFCEEQPQPVECTQDSDCDDNLACNGQETCVDNMCVEGTPIDCSAYDIPPIGTCNNDPDNNPLTWDYGAAFTSQCIEPGICTEGDQEINSTCNVAECGAECDEANPCPSTDCDGLDGCVGDDYYDYHDVENNCLDDCSCQENPCESLTIYPNDERCTGNPVDESLKLYAPFDGNADDMSGNGNNGIVYGAILTADRNGNPNSAYQFNGVDSYIDFGSSDLGLTGGSEMTISVWVKPDTPTTWHSTVLASHAFYRPYAIKTRGLGSAVTAQYILTTSSGGSYIDADAGGIIVGSWYNIACTYDGTTASIYVDGELKNSVSASGTLSTTTQSIFAGANPYPTHYYHGAIDDIRIWNRTLSPSEIQDLQYD